MNPHQSAQTQAKKKENNCDAELNYGRQRAQSKERRAGEPEKWEAKPVGGKASVEGIYPVLI